MVWGGSDSAGIHVGLLAVRLEGGVTMWLSGNNSSGSGSVSKTEAAHSQQQTPLKQEKSGECGQRNRLSRPFICWYTLIFCAGYYHNVAVQCV